MPSDHFCSHFQQEGRINLIPSPECFIFIAVSGDTHIEAILGHMAIWLYGHMAEIWSYGHIAIWLYGIGGGQYGCFYIIFIYPLYGQLSRIEEIVLEVINQNTNMDRDKLIISLISLPTVFNRTIFYYFTREQHIKGNEKTLNSLSTITYLNKQRQTQCCTLKQDAHIKSK